MRSNVSKWGNSLALRLPARMAEDAGLEEGSAVDISIEAESLVVRPARPKYRLDELLAEFRSEHRHGETDWGAPAGKEIP